MSRYAPLLWLPAALLLAGLAGWLVALGRWGMTSAIDSDRLRALLDRLSPADRAAMLETGFACSGRELAPHEPKPRRERARAPAPEHPYRSVRITTEDGTFVRCRVRDCRDARHATMGRLGVIRP